MSYALEPCQIVTNRRAPPSSQALPHVRELSRLDGSPLNIEKHETIGTTKAGFVEDEEGGKTGLLDGI